MPHLVVAWYPTFALMHATVEQYRVGGAALNATPLDWAGNLANIRAAIHEAKKLGITLLCLPELSITGYGCEDLFLHKWVYDEAWARLLTLLPDTKGITVAVGLPYWHLEGRYNGVATLEDGSLQGIRLKHHLPNDGVHYEPRWFMPWPVGEVCSVERDGHLFWIGDVSPEIKLGTEIQPIAFEICEDAWRQDRPANTIAREGITTVLNPSASHFAFGKWQARWQVVAEGSRLINGLYIYVNQLGNEAGRIIYDGDVIIAYQGSVVCSQPRLQLGNVKLAWVELEAGKVVGMSHPADERKEPTKEQEFALAASLGLYDYLRKSRAKCYVLSLSGGADSSTCAVLVAEMVKRGLAELGEATFLSSLGYDPSSNPSGSSLMSKLLITAYQSTQNSGDATFSAAKTLADSIGATFHHWQVQETVSQITETISDALGRPLTWQQDDIALQNVQARARSPYIWMLTNASGGLLLTTSNRSEGDVGYATMDGDTSGSLAPIAGVDKDFVRNWLRWAEAELGYKGLHEVNNLEPTAELRPAERAQTDEKDLMPYPLLAEIERLAIKERRAPEDVYNNILTRNTWPEDVLKTSIVRFYRLWSINQWKRERIAPSFHLDDFNIDPRSWCRFPILSGSFRHELEELQASWA